MLEQPIQNKVEQKSNTERAKDMFSLIGRHLAHTTDEAELLNSFMKKMGEEDMKAAEDDLTQQTLH